MFVVNCNDVRFACERSQSTEAYMKIVRAYEPLGDQETRRLIAVVQKPTSLKEQSKAMNKVVLHNQRFVISVAKKWAKGDNLLDLVNEGNIGLIQAVHNYDLGKDVKFTTYAVHWINQAIRNYIITKEEIVHPANANRIFHYSRSISNRFFIENQRNPSLDELADAIENEFGYKVTDKRDLAEFQRYGLNVEENDDIVAADIRDAITRRLSTDSDVVRQLDSEDMRRQVEGLMKVLTQREREVIGLYFGIDRDRCGGEEMAVNNIALSLELSEQRVRQIIERGVERMRNSLLKCKNF